MNWKPRILAATLLLPTLLYVVTALRFVRASMWAQSSHVEGLARAVELSPSDASHHHTLGFALSTVADKQSAAMEHLTVATELNPHSARYWLDLAGVQLSMGQEGYDYSVAQAVAAEPTRPSVLWAAASFYVVDGNLEAAFSTFKKLLMGAPLEAGRVIELCWRVQPDPQRIVKEVLPETADAYSRFLHFLIGNNETEAADLMWRKLIALGRPVARPLAFSYMEFLVKQRRTVTAQQVWREWLGLERGLESYSATCANGLPANCGFEMPLLNGGFDWRYQEANGTRVSIEKAETGGRVAAVTYDGARVNHAVLRVLVAVRPLTEYRFSAKIRSEDLISAGGPMFVVVDRHTGTLLFATTDILGTNGWQQRDGVFTTSAETDLVEVRLYRSKPLTRIRGKLWVDDVTISATAAEK